MGLNLGARLARAGCEVRFAVRKPEVVRRLATRGVTVVDPGSGESWKTTVSAGADVGEAASWLGGGPLVFCTRTPDLPSVAASFARTGEVPLAVGAGNDVANEPRLASLFRRVAGMVIRQTTTRTDATTVTAREGGRIVVGGYAGEVEPALSQLVEGLEAAGFDVGVSGAVEADKWLKLCINLMSAPNAMVRRSDHTTPAFVETKARLLEEARDTLAAAGIPATSCDGRDRSLDDEIEFQRASLTAGTSRRALPLYNALWTALQNGGEIEADAYHRRIVDLGRAHGVSTPVNERALAVLEACAREGQGPESVAAADLLGAG